MASDADQGTAAGGGCDPIVSGRTAARLIDAAGPEAEASLDLGRTFARIRIESEDILLPDGQRIARRQLAEAFSDPEDCIRMAGGTCRKVYIYSDEQRCYYKLFQPVEHRPPTIVINGATMHAIVGKDPWQDEEGKVGVLPRQSVTARRDARCLDTCFGLGYSAQLLGALGFGEVVTCEVDPHVLDVAHANPWSSGAFAGRPVKIEQRDLREVAAASADGAFSCVFHDPPTVQLAGELYAETLYREFARILRHGGVCYHYVGMPGAKGGRDYARGVMRRMQSAGFTKLRRVTGGVLGMR